MPQSAGSGKACRCVSAERLASASMRRTASSAHALEPLRSRPFRGVVTRAVSPIAQSRAARRPPFAPAAGARAATRSAAYRPADRRRRVDSPRVPLAPGVRRPPRHGSERGHPPRRAGLGRVGVCRVGALRRARGVRLRPRRIHGGRHRRPACACCPAAVIAPFASSLGDRFRRERFLLGVVLLGAAALVVSAAGAADGRSHHRLRRRVRGRCLLDAVPAGARRAAAVAGADGGELIAANGATSTIESLGTLLGPLGAGVLVAFADVGARLRGQRGGAPRVGRPARACLGPGSRPGACERSGRRGLAGVQGDRRSPARAAARRPDRRADVRSRVPERPDRRDRLPGAARRGRRRSDTSPPRSGPAAWSARSARSRCVVIASRRPSPGRSSSGASRSC